MTLIWHLICHTILVPLLVKKIDNQTSRDLQVFRNDPLLDMHHAFTLSEYVELMRIYPTVKDNGWNIYMICSEVFSCCLDEATIATLSAAI
jgi:hypothetical protein